MTLPGVDAIPAWVDIGTAPKDGRPVLAWSRTWKHGMQVVRWEESRGCWAGPAGSKVSPTHWYPHVPDPKM